jgi:hypothetical protein
MFTSFEETDSEGFHISVRPQKPHRLCAYGRHFTVTRTEIRSFTDLPSQTAARKAVLIIHTLPSFSCRGAVVASGCGIENHRQKEYNCNEPDGDHQSQLQCTCPHTRSLGTRKRLALVHSVNFAASRYNESAITQLRIYALSHSE